MQFSLAVITGSPSQIAGGFNRNALQLCFLDMLTHSAETQEMTWHFHLAAISETILLPGLVARRRTPFNKDIGVLQ